MRAEVVAALVGLAEVDERIVFLTGDLGYGVVEPFFERLPERSFNVGVAEQNMVAMATGLAEAGLIPFVYSIATFAALRPFEFIRNGPVAHHQQVRILGVGGGMEYANNGPSHLALEDVGVLRTQPGLRILCPIDTSSAVQMVRSTYASAGPIYYRLSKRTVADQPGLDRTTVDLGAGAHVMTHGDGSVAVLALGAIAGDLGAVAAELARDGIDATTVAVWSAVPAPVELIADIARSHAMVVTLESHYTMGGLGSIVAETIADAGICTRLLRCGVDQFPVGIVGSPEHLARWAGIDPAGVAARVRVARERAT